MKKEDIDIKFDVLEVITELNTWDDLFNITDLYKSTCCKEGAGKYWIQQVIEESSNYGITPKQFLKGKLLEANKNIYSEINFLLKPFLEACERVGLFD